MICKPCKRREHPECINLVKLGLKLSTWCDCQHRPTDQTKVAELGAVNQERIAAVVARWKPQPMGRG